MHTSDAVPFGGRALRFSVNGDARQRRALSDALRRMPGVSDAVVAEEDACVVLVGDRPREEVVSAIARLDASGAEIPVVTPAEHVVDVIYDGEDVDDVARATGLTRDQVISRHAAGQYTVSLVGFLPGFGYLRGLDEALVFARRASPRVRVPARSVAIAASYTGIYPWASPGGWHLLGRASSFQPLGPSGAAFALGDRVRFAPRGAAADAAPHVSPAASIEPLEGPHLEILSAQGLTLVVDGGRVGHMHEGVPHGGPLVAGAFARANVAVGNGRGTAALEVFGALRIAARGGRIAVASDDGIRSVLEDGAIHEIATAGRGRVRYLAVEGGFDVPEVLGSRTTLLVAGLGGFAGRALRRGDRVAVGGANVSTATTSDERQEDRDDRLSIDPGPDATEEALATLVASTFRIAPSSDRVGTRLEGPPLAGIAARVDRTSSPMVHGAIEVTPSGLVVLGPDHPTTGGYPVIGVVRPGSLDTFFSRTVRSEVRFST